MISTASTEDISYGILTENRREFIERAKELGLKQGWNTILFRIIFFDFHPYTNLVSINSVAAQAADFEPSGIHRP